MPLNHTSEINYRRQVIIGMEYMPLMFFACLYCTVIHGLALSLQSGAAELGDSCCVSTGPVTRAPGCENVALVSWLASTWSNDGYRAMLLNRQEYAELHGYTFLEFNESTLPHDLQDKWQTSGTLFKPLLLDHLLQHRSNGTWLVWTDADAMYTNWSKAWETYLDGDIVVAEAPDIIFNNGVFALRVSDLSRAFVRGWIADLISFKPVDGRPPPLADNGAFIHSILRQQMAMANKKYHEDCKVDNIRILKRCYNRKVHKLTKKGLSRSVGPDGMNGSTYQATPIKGVWGINSGMGFAFPNKWGHGDFILHLAGTENKERERLALACTKFCQT